MLGHGFPERLAIEFEEVESSYVRLRRCGTGMQIGETIDDRADPPDDYRFHDVLHMSFFAMLDWSPVLRTLLSLRRHETPTLQAIEDGARAKLVEEGIALFVFAEANCSPLPRDRLPSSPLLRRIRWATSYLEVATATDEQWSMAVRGGLRAWEALRTSRGGCVVADRPARTLLVGPRCGRR